MTDSEKLDLLLRKMESFATKYDLKSFATKDDLKSFATKDDLRHEINLVLEELDSTEQRLNRKIEAADKKILDLRNYVTSSRYSNETVEILMKRQDNVEQRLQKVERKVLYS